MGMPVFSQVLRGGNVESAEKEWEMFKDIVKECTNRLQPVA